MTESYLDNAATTKVDEEAAALIGRIMLEDYGNPSSLHRKGFEAEKYIREAKETFSHILRCRENEIFFTSGGTESDNLALIGAYMANKRRGNHIIISSVEHPAVAKTADFLESRGARVDRLAVDEKGHVDLEQLMNCLDDETILVSVMQINNEIGALEPIREIGEIIHEKQPECLFHVDDIQGFGKLRLIPGECHIDMISVSGHKIHGPKGIGLFYKSERAKVSPLIHGGGHQNGMRSGTENVPGIAAFAMAAKKAYSDLENGYEHMKRLKEIFINETGGIEDTVINGGDVPYIISYSVKNVRSEVLLHTLEESGVYVSAGSACASNKPAVSATLKAIGVKPWQLESTIRISFSAHTTEDEVIYAAQKIKEAVPRLRRFVRR
ncbi:MAG: cysteine desulfurase [Lachnospiraceae bacterium]|nr:cysteine desulfurase [Lachnospiraceae bacterium]